MGYDGRFTVTYGIIFFRNVQCLIRQIRCLVMELSTPEPLLLKKIGHYYPFSFPRALTLRKREPLFDYKTK